MSLAPLVIVAFMVSVLTVLALSVERVFEVLGVTLAVHTVALVLLDVVEVTTVWERERAPRLELVEIQVPPPPKPEPPPPPPKLAPEPPPTPDPEPAKPVVRPTPPRPAVRPPPTPAEPPPPEAPVRADPGGAPTVAMPELGEQAGTVAVRVGKRTTGAIGSGGNGKGPGSGSGSGAGPTPPPVSVATIKTRAMPKGDYGYIDAGRDYPAEARQLGIEGPIRVRLIVDDRGKVKYAVLLNRLGHGLDELALARAKQIEFDPAKDTDDRPVTSVVVWTFNMTLPK